MTHLKIDVQDRLIASTMSGALSNVLVLLLQLCQRLISINFCQLRHRGTFCAFDSSMNCLSSTLIVLKINVETFDDCLYRLDGRLKSLLKLIIHVTKIIYPSRTMDNMVSIIGKDGILSENSGLK